MQSSDTSLWSQLKDLVVFLVTLLGTHWHSLQLWRQQAQFPPQRLTRRQPGQKMVSVLFSSSLMDTEKLRGVQLYNLTSSVRRFRSTTLDFLPKTKALPRSCQVGLYRSSKSNCHLSGSRYRMRSSKVLKAVIALLSRSSGKAEGVTLKDSQLLWIVAWQCCSGCRTLVQKENIHQIQILS